MTTVTTMQALVKTQKGVGFLELQDVEVPRPGPGEVLIEVKACGICGTDVHVLHDEFPYWPPVVLGHEFSGQIVELGPEVQHFALGERVVGEPHTQACGHCYLCRTGNIQICPTKRSPGWGIHGAFTKYLKMPEKLLHRIPDSMSYEVAAVCEPTANTVHDVIERAKIDAGDFVVVLGPGPIGLLAALTARAGGARHIVIIGAPADEAIRLQKAMAHQNLGHYCAPRISPRFPMRLADHRQSHQSTLRRLVSLCSSREYRG